VRIRLATPADLPEVLRVEREAFGGLDEAELVEALLGDPTAQPAISLIAEKDGRCVGHVLFTRAAIEGAEDTNATLLAPLAVVPDEQGRGVGGALATAGLGVAGNSGATVAFVLGHPGYYPRFGFEPALRYGLAAPYPIPEDASDAWMVAELQPGALRALSGTVRVAEALMKPEYWRE